MRSSGCLPLAQRSKADSQIGSLLPALYHY